MILNMNEYFDSYNPDDMDSGDYTYIIDTYSNMGDYDDDDSSPDFYWWISPR